MPDWYCPLPFNSISTTTSGYYRPCCVSPPSEIHVNDMNFREYLKSDYMKELREAFLSDYPREKDIVKKYCDKCIKQEEINVKTRRMRFLEKEYPNFLEMKITGNICNLSCVTCHPFSSSRVEERWKELGIEYPEYGKIPRYFRMDDEWWENGFDQIVHDYDEIKFSGGEPFVSPVFDDIIKRLIKLDWCGGLYITTNGSGSRKNVNNLLQKFRYVTLGVSIDGYQRRGEIIRRESSWEHIQNMIWDYVSLKKKYKEKLDLHITTTTSSLNIGYHNELFEFIKPFYDNSLLKFSISNIVHIPSWANPYMLPNKIKDLYKERYVNSKIPQKLIETILPALEHSEFDDKKFIREFPKLSLLVPEWREFWPEFLPYENISS